MTNVFIVSVEGINWPEDKADLLQQLKEIWFTYTNREEARFSGERAVKAISLTVNPEMQPEEILRQLDKVFDSPTQLRVAIKVREPNRVQRLNTEDELGFERLGQSWPPERMRHPLRSAPFLFRNNGSPLDLVDLFSGQAVFVVCNGPSLKEANLSNFSNPGIVTFGMNNGAHHLRPRLWACVDEPHRFMYSIWADPNILKFVPLAHLQKPAWDRQNSRLSGRLAESFPSVVGFRRNGHFEAARWLTEETINWGDDEGDGGATHSVMLVVLRICHLLGFKRVYLVGCDFYMDETRKYWFDEERSKQAIENNNRAYQELERYFQALRPRFEEAGFSVFNTNPASRLRVFPFQDFNRAIRDNSIDVSDTTLGMYGHSAVREPLRK